MNFSGHVLSTLSLDKFLEGEFESERYAISRLIYNLDHGPEAQGGFMLHYDEVDSLRKSVNRDDYAAFKRNKRDKNIHMYYSHAGLQDDLMWPLWRGLQQVKAWMLNHYEPGSRWHGRMQTLDLYYFVKISHWFVAFLNALAISLFVLWAGREFGLSTGWGTLIFILLAMPVLTYFGRSIWWMMWSWYLPFLIVLWWVHLRRTFNWLDAVGAGVFAGLAIGLKTTMGYEFVSTVMMGVLIPPAFYAVKDSWSWHRWLGVSLIVGLCALAGFAGGLAYHWHALVNAGMDPVEVIQSRFSMRAHGGAQEWEGEIGESVQASVLGVIGGYLVSTKELMMPQILLMAPFLWMAWTRRKKFMEDRVFAAFAAAIAFGFIGAVSMLVILKGHAYIHGFDVVIWSIPLNLFLGAFYMLRLGQQFCRKGFC